MSAVSYVFYSAEAAADRLPSGNFYYHNVGIGATDGKVTVCNDDLGLCKADSRRRQMSVRTPERILSELGHGHVSVLKMDIEGAEWEVLLHLRNASRGTEGTLRSPHGGTHGDNHGSTHAPIRARSALRAVDQLIIEFHEVNRHATDLREVRGALCATSEQRAACVGACEARFGATRHPYATKALKPGVKSRKGSQSVRFYTPLALRCSRGCATNSASFQRTCRHPATGASIRVMSRARNAHRDRRTPRASPERERPLHAGSRLEPLPPSPTASRICSRGTFHERRA